MKTFRLQIGLKFKEELVKCYIQNLVFVVLKIVHFGKLTENTWEVLNFALDNEEDQVDGLCEKRS